MLFSCHLNSCFTLLQLNGACLELKSLQSKETEDGSETEAELDGTSTVDDDGSAVITLTSRNLRLDRLLGDNRLSRLLRSDGLSRLLRSDGLSRLLRSDGLSGLLRGDGLARLLGVLALIALTSGSVGVARDRLSGLLGVAGNDRGRLRDPGRSVSLDDGAGAVGDGQSARLSDDVVLAAKDEAGGAGAVGGVDVVHLGDGDGTVGRAGGNRDRTRSGGGLGSGEASKGKDDGVLGVHFEGFVGWFL
jgi:hypothetical protein